MGARGFWHRHKTISFKDHFHFFTLHGRLPRNTHLRKSLRLDPEYDRATCLRSYRTPRNFPYCSSIAVSRLRFRCMPFLARLLPNFFLEQIAQPGARSAPGRNSGASAPRTACSENADGKRRLSYNRENFGVYGTNADTSHGRIRGRAEETSEGACCGVNGHAM